MDALERCARMVRDAEDPNGNLPVSHWVDAAEWEAIQLCIMQQHPTATQYSMATLEVMGVPVRKFEIVGQGPYVFKRWFTP